MTKSLLKYSFLISAIAFLIKCSDNKNSNQAKVQIDSTIKTQDSLILIKDTIPALPLINYIFISPPKQNRYKFLIENYDTIGAKIILALNRLDERFIRKPDSIVVPDTIINDKLLYSPFPKHIALLESVKKILLVDQHIQAFAAYEYGNLVNWGPTSTGKRSTPTPNGLFHTNWKAKETISTDNEDWILPWYFNLENFRGISIHQFELPGYPASHACVRLLEEDAFWIYNWAEQWILTKDGEFIIAYGTPVIIYGQYDFKGIKPWLLLPTEPEKAMVNEDELNEIINEHILTIINRQEEREKIINPQLSLSN
ncbi:L,D-transpeptidase [Ignavibacterium sp.]|uniref:L,D-transpeptidase n=1 Tax=Ignavibacterium sp. TaxID=2651167 RepID=UPI0021FABF9B|nr:L,D-transpeptidase [Ignavibacterium sp.]BDQ03274.1 MAG: hypothetical protein KatS3mg037_1849 [Ignavibacterium sp.]